jgi:hypothetical protein
MPHSRCSSSHAAETAPTVAAAACLHCHPHAQVRVNTISAGPLGSRAAKAIGFIDDMIRYSYANAPVQKELAAQVGLVPNKACTLCCCELCCVLSCLLWVLLSRPCRRSWQHRWGKQGVRLVLGCAAL